MVLHEDALEFYPYKNDINQAISAHQSFNIVARNSEFSNCKVSDPSVYKVVDFNNFRVFSKVFSEAEFQ